MRKRLHFVFHSNFNESGYLEQFEHVRQVMKKTDQFPEKD